MAIAARCSVSDLRPVHSSQFGQLSELRLIFASSVSEYLHFDTVNHDAVELIKALVVGNRQELFESDFYNQVKTVGLAHLVAVSGAHLVIGIGYARAVSLHAGKSRCARNRNRTLQ